MVSIHAPVKGATAGRTAGAVSPNGFNPRTREGCDHLLDYDLEPYNVSIHAPVKGATANWLGVSPRVIVSIHAPVKGATGSSRQISGTDKRFNPRTREGCDGVLPGGQRLAG